MTKYAKLAHKITRMFPQIQIRNKRDYWLWRIMPRRLRKMGHCSITIKRWRLVPVIWLPEGSDARLYQCLAHEATHATDMIRIGVLRWLGEYATRKGRVELEARGYMMSIHAHVGYLPEQTRRGWRCALAEQYAGYIASWRYLWPCRKDVALERLLEYCAHMNRGMEVSGLPEMMMQILDGIEVNCNDE